MPVALQEERKGWRKGGHGTMGHAVSCKDKWDIHHHRMFQEMERGRCWGSTLRWLEGAKSHDKEKEDDFQDPPGV